MKCRKIIAWTDDNGVRHQDIVWFGAVGKRETVDSEGNTKEETIFVNENNKSIEDSYDADSDAIASALTEKLSVLKGELWFDKNYGVPLFDKVNTKTVIDAYVVKVITEQEGVKSFNRFKSIKKEHDYACAFVLNTDYGELKGGV